MNGRARGTRIRNPEYCTVDQCDNSARTRGLCNKHYSRYHRHGDPNTVKQIRNGRRTSQGYVYLHKPFHPASDGNGYVAEHRLVMENMLGRYLLPDENVHHKNGIRWDNIPSNLELWVSAQPAGQRVTDLVAFAHAILERYGNEAEQMATG